MKPTFKILEAILVFGHHRGTEARGKGVRHLFGIQTWLASKTMKTRFPTIPEIEYADDGVYMCFSHDPERSMLLAFAEALLKHAHCGHCYRSIRPDFGPCECNKDLLTWLSPDEAGCSLLHAEHSVWRDILELLWHKDQRRIYSQTSRDRRTQSIKESDEPSFTASDIVCLRKAQNDACYYCGTSIRTSAQVEHLDPLIWGGSNGFVNIMLACGSCNAAKHSLNEPQFWKKLRRQLPPSQFERRRTAAKEMKKAKWRCYREMVRASQNQGSG